MQFAGAPDSLVWKLNENNDYSDDFQGRGEWVNYLRGTPYGPNLSRGAAPIIPPPSLLKFFFLVLAYRPIENSLFAFSYGMRVVTRNDSVIGTLSIYSPPWGM